MKCRLGLLLTGGLLAAIIGLVIAVPMLVLVVYQRSKDKAATEALDETETG